MAVSVDFTKVRKKIRTRRKALNMTQAVLAEKSELSEEHTNKIEKGKSKPGVDALVGIARALDVTANDLLYDDRPSVPKDFKLVIEDLCSGCTPDEQQIVLAVIRALTDHFSSAKPGGSRKK